MVENRQVVVIRSCFQSNQTTVDTDLPSYSANHGPVSYQSGIAIFDATYQLKGCGNSFVSLGTSWKVASSALVFGSA